MMYYKKWFALCLCFATSLFSASFQNTSNVIERGLGALIDNSAASEQALALHRSLNIGKTYWLKNPTNNLEIPIKIIGRLPNTGLNEKIIIRISHKAYQKLLFKGKKFPVEILNNATTYKITHETEQGETLFSIAKKYQVPVEKLRKWNELDSNSLKLGQKIVIYKTRKSDN